MPLLWDTAEVVPVGGRTRPSYELRVELNRRPDRFWRRAFDDLVGDVLGDGWQVVPPPARSQSLTVHGPLSRDNIDQVAAVLDELLERIEARAEESAHESKERRTAKQHLAAEQLRVAAELTKRLRAKGKPRRRRATPTKQRHVVTAAPPVLPLDVDPPQLKPIDPEEAILAQFAYLFDGLPEEPVRVTWLVGAELETAPEEDDRPYV